MARRREQINFGLFGQLGITSVVPGIARQCDIGTRAGCDRIPININAAHVEFTKGCRHRRLVVVLAVQRHDDGRVGACRAGALRGWPGERAMRCQFEEDVGAERRCSADSLRIAHRLAQVVPPVVGVEAAFGPAGDGGNKGNRWRLVGNFADLGAEPGFTGFQEMAMPGGVGFNAACEDFRPFCVEACYKALDGIGITRDGEGRGRIVAGDFDTAVGRQETCQLVFGETDDSHGPLSRRLGADEAAGVDVAHGGFQIDGAGNVGSGDLTEAMPDDHIGVDTAMAP